MHIPVLVDEVSEYLKVAEGRIFFDGTVGLGGHTAAILKASSDNFVYGTDKDGEALKLAKNNLTDFTGRFQFFNTDFKNAASLPVEIDKIDGFLFDLGVSSYQLDRPERGFSYSKPAPLDMRMDNKQELTACEVLNTYSYQALFTIFREYGEIKNPAKILDRIIYQRKNKKIEHSDELKTIIRKIYPRQKAMDPLSRIFQALRIEVNRELEGLEDFFIKLFRKMKAGSRVVIISFHSLEDRIAKSALKKGEDEKVIEILTKKPLTAGQGELAMNARSRSAKLRAGFAPGLSGSIVIDATQDTSQGTEITVKFKKSG